MSYKYIIIDCYVDEPACFGVPPFISPYPRYIYGALLDAGASPENIKYLTIDFLRENDYLLTLNAETVFLIGGAVVPGKYLGAKIGTLKEISKIIEINNSRKFIIGGLVSRFLRDNSFKNITIIRNDIEKFAFHYVKGSLMDSSRDNTELKRWSALGAQVVREHPGYPDLVCEIETYRGCPRKGHCSFCSEAAFKEIFYREVEDIISEIKALCREGISRFRLGRQADILAYKSSRIDYKKGFPKPDPLPLAFLFSKLKEMRESGEIKTLNIDNANPGTIVNFPEESSEILESIVQAITPGDTLALGVESLDPKVIAQNNLKVNREELVFAVELINQIGGRRVNGLPVLLPGINLIHGLKGENSQTFKQNYEALLDLRDRGLLLKRTNIRKILPFPGTPAFNAPGKINKTIENRYNFYRKKIRQEIDQQMLKIIYPAGTVLNEMQVLEKRFDYSYAKQPASYSITAKIPLPLELNNFIDVIVIDHQERSVLALPVPVKLNELPLKAIETIPGIGKKRAKEIFLKRPFKTIEEIEYLIKDIEKEITRRIYL